jgi:hypothetical protein
MFLFDVCMRPSCIRYGAGRLRCVIPPGLSAQKFYW